MDIIKEPPVTITLAGEELELEYTLASLHFLTKKHPDLPEFLKTASGNGKAGLERLSGDFIEAMAEFVYAGLYRPDDEGNDTSGWSVFKVMKALHPSELGEVSRKISKAFEAGGPRKDPHE
jgi:hypothetical protein